jgi:uncharacterized membrane protein (DUF106 family)
MNAVQRAREVRRSRVGGRRSPLITFTVAVVLVGLMMTTPALAQSATAKVSLSSSSEGAGVTIGITASGLVANRNISAKFGNMSLSLSGTCTTNSAGGLSSEDDCSFVVPHVSSGSYTVTVSDGTNNYTVAFKIPVVTIPESTLLVTMTSIGLSLVTQLVTRRVVNLDTERRMKAEVSAFNKEKREATLKKDKAKLEKLKKREVPMRQEQAKVSAGRLKVTAITFVPLLAVYYLMASFLGGFNVVVAYSPVPIPLLVGPEGIMALFWWYMLSSFTFSTLLTKLLHTTT